MKFITPELNAEKTKNPLCIKDAIANQNQIIMTTIN